MGHLPARLKALLVVLALTTLVGCQGFSSGKTNIKTQDPGVLSAAPPSVAFGNVLLGTTQSQSVSLANTGGSSLTVSQMTVTGTGFSTNGLVLPMTLAAGQGVSFNVVFGPQSAGDVTGNLAFTNDASSTPLNVALTATGVSTGGGGGGITESPTSFSFGSVQDGTSQSQNETLTNGSSQSFTISQATFSGTGYSTTGLTLPLTLAPNQSVTFAVVFTPTTAGPDNGLLALTISGSATAIDFSLSGIGVPVATLSPSPASLTFTSIQVGQNQAQTETVQNTGGENATISQVKATGTGFSISGITTPLTLTPGQSTSFSVTYAPQTAGSASGSVTITSNASNPSLSVALSGTAVAAGTLTGNPTSFSFGNVQDGTSQSQTETLKNTGGTSLTVTQATISGAGFSYTGLTLPLTLTANQSTTFSVVFAPTTAGAVTGTLALTASGSTTPLNLALSGTGVTLATLTANPTSLTFTNVTVGQTLSQTETVKNTGGENATISQVKASGTGFSVSGITTPVTLTPGQSTSFSVTFAPTTAGSASGSVTITSDASNPSLSVALSGTATTPGALAGNPTSFSFGNVQDGTSQSQTETLKNTGGTSLTITQATISGAGFSYTGLTLPLTLTANQSTTFSVVFAPTTPGAVVGTLALTISGSSPLNLALAGTGVTPATLTANPTSLTFTNVTVGQTQSQTETVKNTGGVNATISQVKASGTGFSISGITTPVTLTPGQSTSFSVTFAPTSAGSASGSVTITSNASNPSLSVALSGTAVTAAALTGNPTSFSFGNVQDGTSQSQTETLKNTGGTSLTITQATISGAGFSYTGLTLPLTLAPNQSSTFAVVFAPTTPGAVAGTLALTVSGSSPLNLALSGTGVTPATLTANPTSFTFTNVTVGQSQSQTETVKNTGGVNATISQVTVAGTGFSFSGITTPLTLTPGQSTSFSVTFAPTSAGSASGSVMIDSNATDPALSVALSGTAVAQTQGTLTVSAVNVGNVVVGTSGTQTGTLSVTGANISVTSVSLSGSNPGEFAITGLTFPVAVTTTTPVTFTVKFTPGSTGAASASASFVSTAANTPTAGALSGTGTPAPVHTVSLSWTASSTSGITSYNVYRAIYASNVCGSYTNVGTTASSVTAFTDNGPLTNGTTYCYATTAVDANGESGYSNIVQAAIP
jgi:Abnormal spindle-like microcephaly-assoc'd, ASPM-SPD-2-Hydin